jgi:hypothetical protein
MIKDCFGSEAGFDERQFPGQFQPFGLAIQIVDN